MALFYLVQYLSPSSHHISCLPLTIKASVGASWVDFGLKNMVYIIILTFGFWNDLLLAFYNDTDLILLDNLITFHMNFKIYLIVFLS